MSRHNGVYLGRSNVLLTATAVLATAYYLYKQKAKQKANEPRETLAQLRGNFYTTGSDVCRFYKNSIRDKVIVITGTSSGLGFHAAKLLGKNGAYVIMGVRHPEHCHALVEEIQTSGGRAIALPLDLASFSSVQQFSKQVRSTLLHNNNKLQVLIHNAGVSFLNATTEDGYQRVWQVNALAPALLTELLLPVMVRRARILHVSSEMHRYQ